jgi:hypothetical protein
MAEHGWIEAFIKYIIFEKFLSRNETVLQSVSNWILDGWMEKGLAENRETGNNHEKNEDSDKKEDEIGHLTDMDWHLNM